MRLPAPVGPRGGIHKVGGPSGAAGIDQTHAASGAEEDMGIVG